MRAVGFLLIVFGIFIVYLGWNGKITPAFLALMGKGVPGNAAPSYKTSPSLNDNPSGKPGHGGMWGDAQGGSVNATGL